MVVVVCPWKNKNISILNVLLTMQGGFPEGKARHTHLDKTGLVMAEKQFTASAPRHVPCSNAVELVHTPPVSKQSPIFPGMGGAGSQGVAEDMGFILS
jgi:hypothetical protein